MSAVATAIVGGALVSGYMSGEAAEASAEASAGATDRATALSERQFDIARQDMMPYSVAGRNALSQYSSRLGLGGLNQQDIDRSGEIDREISEIENEMYAVRGHSNPAYEAEQNARIQTLRDERGGLQLSTDGGALEGEVMPRFDYQGEMPEFQGGDRFEFDLEADPGYQFARDEAIRATTRQAAAGNQRMSGNVLAAITDRAGGVASQFANDAFQRQMAQSREGYGRGLTEYDIARQREGETYGRQLGEYGLQYGQEQDYMNRLSSLAGMGMGATGQTNQMGMQTSTNIGNMLMANTANQGSSAAMRYGGINQAIQGGLSNYMGYQQNQNLMNMLAPRPVAGDAYMPGML